MRSLPNMSTRNMWQTMSNNLPTKCDQIVQLKPIYLAQENKENYKHMNATGLAGEPQKFRSWCTFEYRVQILILFINHQYSYSFHISDLLVTTWFVLIARRRKIIIYVPHHNAKWPTCPRSSHCQPSLRKTPWNLTWFSGYYLFFMDKTREICFIRTRHESTCNSVFPNIYNHKRNILKAKLCNYHDIRLLEMASQHDEDLRMNH